MHVMIVDSAVAPGRTGESSLIAERIAAEVRAAGHHPVLVSTTRRNGLPRGNLVRYALDEIPVVAVTTDHPTQEDRAFADARIARRFHQVLTALEPDVVVFHDVQQFGIESVRRTTAAGVPAVVVMHDPWWICERQHMIRSTGEPCLQTDFDLDVCATCVDQITETRRHHRAALEVLNAVRAVVVSDRAWAAMLHSAGVRAGLIRVVPRPRTRRSQNPSTPRRGPRLFGWDSSAGSTPTTANAS